MNFQTKLESIRNDLKIAIDDTIDVIADIHEDVESLKNKALKPDKKTAQVLLEYVAMEDCKTKENLKIL